jgi:hypothetical protein
MTRESGIPSPPLEERARERRPLFRNFFVALLDQISHKPKAFLVSKSH